MNDLIQPFIVLIVLVLMLVPFFIVVSALFPKRVLKTQANIDLMPGRSFTVGLVNFLFFFAIALVLFILADKTESLLKGILSIPAVTIFVVLAIALSLGLAGLVNLLGERVAPAQSLWRRALWGTLLLGVACAVPFVGWFLLLPYAGCIGIGALIFSFIQPDRPILPKE
jgi:hypothetical protein